MDAAEQQRAVAASAARAGRAAGLSCCAKGAAACYELWFRKSMMQGHFIETVLADQKSLVLPRVDSATHSLMLHHVFETIAWFPGLGNQGTGGGLPCVLTIDDIDFILVPGSRLTGRGPCIGYGAGFTTTACSCAVRVIPIAWRCVRLPGS